MRHICFPGPYHLLGCLCRPVCYLYTSYFSFNWNHFVAQIGQVEDTVLIRHHYRDMAISFSGCPFPRIMYSRANHTRYANMALTNALNNF